MDKNKDNTPDTEEQEEKGNCRHCGGKFKLEDMVPVLTGRWTTEEWCETCRDNGAMEDYYTEELFSTSHVEYVTLEDNCNACCTLRSAEDNAFQSEHDSHVWFEDEDERDRYDQRIPGYHTVHRPWDGRVFPATHRGAELEVELTDRQDFYDWMQSHHPEFIGETDGSLAVGRGIEIIAPPYNWETGEFLNKWAPILDALNNNHYTDTPDNAGLHITMDHTSVGVDTGRALCVLVHRYHRWFKRLTGRDSGYGRYNPAHRWDGYLDSHSAISTAKTGRIEWRIFRSTLDLSDFRVAGELMAMAYGFAREASPLLFQRRVIVLARAWRRYLTAHSHLAPNLHRRAEDLGLVDKAGKYQSLRRSGA